MTMKPKCFYLIDLSKVSVLNVAKDQYGDSCEECGATYSPGDIKNPVSTVTNTTPVTKKQNMYFSNSVHMKIF